MEEVRGDSVRVRIVQTSACAACKVAGHCSAAESKEKVVEVVDGRAAAYAPGDNVVVSIEPSIGRRAVILAFVVPFLILVAVLVIALWAIGDEGPVYLRYHAQPAFPRFARCGVAFRNLEIQGLCHKIIPAG